MIILQHYNLTNNAIKLSIRLKINRALQVGQIPIRYYNTSLLLSTSFYNQTTLCKKVPLFFISKRYMRLSKIPFVKPPNNLTANPTSGLRDHLIKKRGMACIHSGKIKAKTPLAVQQTDVSGKHDVIVVTTCATPECKDNNCASPTSTIQCPGRTAQQNQQTIPPTNQGFETHVVGNYTKTIPAGTQGITVDPQQTYKGDNKPQQIVLETNPSQINSNTITVRPISTNYSQQKDHHETIMQNVQPST